MLVLWLGETNMEWATKAMNAVNKASNNKTVINVFLFGSFAALSIRSLNQQRDIETLEAEKDSLVKANKSMKKTIWDWKQQLYTEATSSDKPLVPLSKLKAIYGELPSIPPGQFLFLSLYISIIMHIHVSCCSYQYICARDDS